MKVQGNIQVKGKVQGVWFRAFTKEKAEKIGLTGWVHNQASGSVYLEVNGNKKDTENPVACKDS